jgi:DDE superfamily endonuclease.
MMQLAERFVQHKIDKHGPDIWVIAFCDNLKAHVSNEVRDIFGRAKVLLCFLPPNMTHIAQPIDAGIVGQTLRIAVGNGLDEWLMDADNMSKWETKMTASERQILITRLVGAAMKHVMAPGQDSMRISAFERTGCLIRVV